MALNWQNEPWRKLYTRITSKWRSLSVAARGLADELIKYADDDGELVDVGAEDPGEAVALMLSAKPKEHAWIKEAVAELLEDGYLVIKKTTLKIRNFSEAQTKRSPEAIRQARKRERDKQRDMSRDSHGAPSRDTSNAMSPGNETKRNETIPPSPPSGGDLPEQVPGWFSTAWCKHAGVAMLAPGALTAVWPLVSGYAAAKGRDPEAVAPVLLTAYSRVTSGWNTKHPWTPTLFVKHFDRVQSEAEREVGGTGTLTHDAAVSPGLLLTRRILEREAREQAEREGKA
jgi:hypothetical protein